MGKIFKTCCFANKKHLKLGSRKRPTPFTRMIGMMIWGHLRDWAAALIASNVQTHMKDFPLEERAARTHCLHREGQELASSGFTSPCPAFQALKGCYSKS
jgi:hypothetical protein